MSETLSRRSTRTWWLAGAALVALVAIGALVVLWRAPRDTEAPQALAPAGGTGDATRTHEGGQVTVKVTPLAVDAGIAFTVVLDTHAVDLDGYDLQQLATLRVGDTELLPTSWDAPKGGHHRQGTLRFPAADTTGPVELIIRDVAGVPARSFQWPRQ